MSAKRTFVWDIRHDAALHEIENALRGLPDGDERRHRIEDLSASLRSNPPAVMQAVSAAIVSALQAGIITEEEADRLLEPYPVGS